MHLTRSDVSFRRIFSNQILDLSGRIAGNDCSNATAARSVTRIVRAARTMARFWRALPDCRQNQKIYRRRPCSHTPALLLALLPALGLRSALGSTRAVLKWALSEPLVITRSTLEFVSTNGRGMVPSLWAPLA